MKNRVILIGNLGKSPELRNTGKTSVANFSVATSETFKDSEGTVAKYLKKGSKVCVEGRLKTRKREDKEDATRYTTEVIATEVKFLDAKHEDAEQGESATA